MTKNDCYKKWDKLAPMGVFKQAFALYEQQTREFVKNRVVSNDTAQEIILFNLWCTENEYINMVVIPIWYQMSSNANLR